MPRRNGRLETTLEFVKGMAWPLVAVIALLLFGTQVRQCLNQIPMMMSSSNTIAIGGLKIELDQRLKRQASPEVRKAIGDLSGDAVLKLMDMGEKSFFVDQVAGGMPDPEKASFDELGKTGLVAAFSMVDEDGQARIAYCPTKLGLRAYRIMQSATIHLFKPDSNEDSLSALGDHADFNCDRVRRDNAARIAAKARLDAIEAQGEVRVAANERADADLVKRFVELEDMDSLKATIEEMPRKINSIVKDLSPVEQQEATGMFRATLDISALATAAQKIARDTYTKDEMREAIRFDESPAGLALQAKNAKFNQRFAQYQSERFAEVLSIARGKKPASAPKQ